MKRILLVALIFIIGCAQTNDFGYGAKQINLINSKYNTTMETYPGSIIQIDLMLNDYQELKKIQLQAGQEQFNYLIDYRTLNLEAEKLYIRGQKYGLSGTTKEGFGCKSRPLILESVFFRNSSALKGFEAVDLVRQFVNKYPEDAKSAGLSAKNALFLNATFYEISREARADSNIINRFCPQNVTLELYQQEIRKKTNITEDIIMGMSYDEAVKLWKLIRGII
ncbi:hypothetical protein J4480_04150 [Candidatus Woesearchaeota archaeon]|nr:hypothetical protein [Candidatus Woesearchaeota archaeon]